MTISAVDLASFGLNETDVSAIQACYHGNTEYGVVSHDRLYDDLCDAYDMEYAEYLIEKIPADFIIVRRA